MIIYLAEKIKELRAEKGISQDKLAQYLNVSFQAVSKWENGSTYPDISLLPEIARFFNVTVDELLQVEKIDEQKLYAEFENRACELFRNGDMEGNLALWQEAYHAMPNNTAVKEMLMSAYYDADKLKYCEEIVSLGTELYRESLAPDKESLMDSAYYRGQTVRQLAITLAEKGDLEAACRWVEKATCLMHSQELVFTEITHGSELLGNFSFANYHYFESLIYMARRVAFDDELNQNGYGKEILKTVADMYQLLYPDGDMDFELLKMACILHCDIAKIEAGSVETADSVRSNLEKAARYAEKSVNLKQHTCTAPLFKGLEIYGAPSDSRQIVRELQKTLQNEIFEPYRSELWFDELEKLCRKV